MYWICSSVRIRWPMQLPPYKGANHFKGIHEALSRAGLSIPLIPWNRPNRRTANQQNDLCAKLRQINLDIHPVWSEKHWVRGYPLNAQRRFWSDWADVHADDLQSSPCALIILFVLSCSGSIASFPVAKNQNRHFLRSLFPKIVFVPLFPSFLDLVPLK